MEKVPTFAEFVKAYFPEEERPKGFHLEFIEKISEQIEALKPGQTLVIDTGRCKPFYINLARIYQESKSIAENGIHANSVIVDDCIAMPSRLHEVDELGKLTTGGLSGLKHIKLDDE